MRVFCAIRHSNDPRQFYGGLWTANFYPALRQLNHEIIESTTDLAPTSQFMSVATGFTPEEREVRSRTTEQIVGEVREALRHGPVDLFLSYFYNAHFDPSGFDELRKMGVPSINFYCNSIYQFENVASIAAKADFAWHTEKDARSLYLAVGANPIWLQMAADPAVYHPLPASPRRARAVFIGQRYADRARWLAALVQANVPIDVFGAGWQLHEVQTNRADVKAKENLGRRNLTPGSTESYLHVAAKMIRQQGPIRGVARVLKRAQYRRVSRKWLAAVSQHIRGFADNISNTLAEYEVCLNCSNVWADGHPGSQLIPHVRLRDFEAPMCRTCYITGHTDELSEFYEFGREIDTYRTREEFVEKTTYYLKHPAQAEKVREAGYRRAIQDHTWKRRFEELFTRLRLVKPYSVL
jgi:spore maturation protein CgeB